MISGNELLFSFPGAQEGTGSMGRLYHMPQNMYVFIIITYSLIKSGFFNYYYFKCKAYSQGI